MQCIFSADDHFNTDMPLKGQKHPYVKAHLEKDGRIQIHISNCLWGRKGKRTEKRATNCASTLSTLFPFFHLKQNLKQICQNVNIC